MKISDLVLGMEKSRRLMTSLLRFTNAKEHFVLVTDHELETWRNEMRIAEQYLRNIQALDS